MQDTLNHFGAQFLSFAWPMLWQSSLLIAVVFAVDRLFARKLRASVRHALWLVVLIKLLLPPTLALPTSVAWWLFPAKPVIQQAFVLPPPSQFHTSVVVYDDVPSPTFVQDIPQVEPPRPALDLAGWIILAIGAVSGALLVWLLLRWWQLTLTVRNATSAEAFPNMPGVVANCSAGHQLGSLITGLCRAGQVLGTPTLRVKIIDAPISPAVFGLFRPVILLPRTLADKLSPAQLRAVLLHEVIHIRRRDIWVNFAQSLLQILYWWHPLVWIANARIRRVREEVVDDAVMFTLADDADTYAPTLLEVAKLALHRPLMSLGIIGMIGIIESRSALRQRVERIVMLESPRRAGLTLVSVCAIGVFSAVALPMGQGPARIITVAQATPAAAPDQAPEETVNPPEEQSLTVTVNPETFVQNIEAEAAKLAFTPTNDCTSSLIDMLRSEGVDCAPPHGLAFNTQTGEITTQNTPDKLEIFRQVIEQLNRTDGKYELPLRNTSFRRPGVLIEGRFFHLSSSELKSLVSDLAPDHSQNDGCEDWFVAPDQFTNLNQQVKSLGLKPFQSPRVQTSHGTMAQFFVGTSIGATNYGLELDCKPFVIDGGVELGFKVHINDLPLPDGWAAGANHAGAKQIEFKGRTGVQDDGGLIIRADTGDQSVTNLVLIAHVKVLTNNLPGRSENHTGAQGVLTDPNFRVALRALQQRAGVETLGEPEITTLPLRTENRGEIYPPRDVVVPFDQNSDAATVVNQATRNDPAAPQILVSTRLYWMPGFLFQNLVSHLSSNRGYRSDETRWSIQPEEFSWTSIASASSDCSLLDARRILTSSGNSIWFYGGNGFDSLQFDCLPTVHNGLVHLDMTGDVIHSLKNSRNAFHTGISAENLGGAVVRFDGTDDWASSNFVAIIDVLYFTNSTAVPTSGSNSFLTAGKLFLDNHRLDEAESCLHAALKSDPQNSLAKHYLELIDQEHQKSAAAWADELRKTREKTTARLKRIRIPYINFDNATLGNVEAQLNEMAAKYDSEKQDITGPPFFLRDKNDANALIKVAPMTNVLLSDVVDAVVRGSSPPVDYSYNLVGVIFYTLREPKLTTSREHTITPQSNQSHQFVGNAVINAIENKISAYPVAAVDAGPALTQQQLLDKFNQRAQNGFRTNLIARTFRIDPNAFYQMLKDAGHPLPPVEQLNGLSLIETNLSSSTPSPMTQAFFDSLGIDSENPPGKVIFFKNRMGYLFVKATAPDLDTIERAFQKLNTPPPQLHIKARFYEVPKDTLKNFNTTLNAISPAPVSLTGILTSPNANLALKALQSANGVVNLGEPEITVMSGRRFEVSETEVQTIVTNIAFRNVSTNQNDAGVIEPQTSRLEIGPILDAKETILDDGYTIELSAKVALNEFFGYAKTPSKSTRTGTNSLGQVVDVPLVWPAAQTRSAFQHANLYDGQTLVFSLDQSEAKPMQFSDADDKHDTAINRHIQDAVKKNGEKQILVFITPTIVNVTGARIHSDKELPFAMNQTPVQPSASPDDENQLSAPAQSGILNNTNFQAALKHLEKQQAGVKKLGEPAPTVVRRRGFGENRLASASAPVSTTLNDLIQDGKVFYQMGRYDEARDKLNAALAIDPMNGTARYYLDLITMHNLGSRRLVDDHKDIEYVTTNWAESFPPGLSSGRKAIISKLDSIHLPSFSFYDMRLDEILKQLAEESRLRDPERKGINFLINNGAPLATNDLGSYRIKIPSLTDVRLVNVLDAIVLVSDHPLKYSVEDFAVVFSANHTNSSQLFTRTFRIDPNVFYPGLENASTQSFSPAQNSNNMESSNGLAYITTQTSAATPSALARAFFTALGVDLLNPPGKSVYYNDRRGYLFVKATESDLDTIERALQTINQAQPQPQVHLKARFVEGENLSDVIADSSNHPGPFTSVLTDPDLRVALHSLTAHKDAETLGEPEVTVLTGRQVQMRATSPKSVVVGLQANTSSPGNLIVQSISSPNEVLAQFSPGFQAFRGGGSSGGGGIYPAYLTEDQRETERKLMSQTLGGQNEQSTEIHVKVRFIAIPKESIADVAKYLNTTNRDDGRPMGILSPATTQAVLQILRSRNSTTTLAEPQITSNSGRHCQLRTTDGPLLDETASVLADGDTVNLKVSPLLQTQHLTANVNVWDGQTLILTGMEESPSAPNTETNAILVFITPTLIDSTGTRIHSDLDLIALPALPPQMDQIF